MNKRLGDFANKASFPDKSDIEYPVAEFQQVKNQAYLSTFLDLIRMILGSIDWHEAQTRLEKYKSELKEAIDQIDSKIQSALKDDDHSISKPDSRSKKPYLPFMDVVYILSPLSP